MAERYPKPVVPAVVPARLRYVDGLWSPWGQPFQSVFGYCWYRQNSGVWVVLRPNGEPVRMFPPESSQWEVASYALSLR